MSGGKTNPLVIPAKAVKFFAVIPDRQCAASGIPFSFLSLSEIAVMINDSTGISRFFAFIS